jgi:AraC-like DNA-binding protein
MTGKTVPSPLGARQPGARVDDPGTVRMAVLGAIPALLRDRRVELSGLLAEVGLPLDQFDHPDNRMSYRTGGQLLQRCAEATGCEHFGLLVGQYPTALSLGMLGELAQRSRTVQAAIRSLIAHLHLQTRGGIPTHSVRGLNATFGYALYLRDLPATAHIYDLVMAFEFNILRDICGPRWGPSEIWFAHGEPRDLAPYENHFGCKLMFDADRTEILFNRHWLAQPPAGSDPDRHRHLSQEILAQETSNPESLIARVRVALRKMVTNGRATEALLSNLLAIPMRTLRRLLEQEGTSFRELIEEARYEVARQLLLDTDLPTAEIAASLDYADASAFSRAFSRWTGMPPAGWRSWARGQRTE